MFYSSFLALTLATAAVAAPVAPPSTLTLQQKASYLFGQQVARTLKQFDLDDATLLQSLADAKAGKPSPIPEAEAQTVMAAWQKEIQGREAKKGEARKESNKAWLAENAKKPGMKTTPSGLQYRIVASGQGKQPGGTDKVSVNYKGTLIDGTVFDSSAKHGGPATFGVGQVIKGWTEALKLMHEGDKWELFIPAELAYGEKAPPSIGSNQILVFEVELVKVGVEVPAKVGVEVPAKQ